MISHRWIINGALVILVAALTYAGFTFDQNAGNETGPAVSSLSPADVTRIEIRAAGSLLKLQRVAGSWNIESPVDWPAYDANVERLLSILRAEASPLADAADVDLENLGLNPPGASLLFNDTRLLFGATNNIGGRRYVMIDSTLYLLADMHLAFVSQGLSGMVDRRLLPPRYRIAALRLPGFEIVRGADDDWRSTSAFAYSPAELEQLVANWQGLQASRIKPIDADSTPAEQIEIRLQDGRVIDFLLMSTTPEVVIANPQIGLQYHFRADYYEQLISIRKSDNGG